MSHVHFHYTPRPAGLYSQIGFLLKLYLVALLNYRLEGSAMQEQVLRMREAMQFGTKESENWQKIKMASA